MDKKNRTATNIVVHENEVEICLFCYKNFTANKEIIQLIPPKKILEATSSAFKISPGLQDVLDERSLPQNLCCPSCFCTLFDISRLQKEIKVLEQSVRCLVTALRTQLVRSCRRSRNGNSDLDGIRGTLWEKLQEKEPLSLNTRQRNSLNGSYVAGTAAERSDEAQTSDDGPSDIDFENSDDFSQTCENRSSTTCKRIKSPVSSGAKWNAQKTTKSIARSSKPRRPIMNRRAPTLWFTCPYCKKSYVKADFKRETAGDFIFRCEISGCSREFYNFVVFQKHHELTCPMRPCVEKFRCDVCGKQCSSFRTLERHKVSYHTKDYEYYCEKCGAGSVSKGALNRHMLCHTNEKQFICHVCDKSFKRKMQLKYHLMRHNNELPFMCDHCGKRFLDPQKLKRHSASHVALKQYPCPFCSKLFATKNYVYNHIYCTHKHRRPPRRAAKQNENLLSATEQITPSREIAGDEIDADAASTSKDND